MRCNDKFGAHIQCVTHLVMLSHRSCFDFHLFNPG
ncbi:leader peptide SpeFL [Yersinia mollaretii]|nr:leader peptide SpeFL [Yersinia mollaretii]